MKILIEEYRYNATDVKDILRGIDALENVDGYVSVNYVGYYFNTQLTKPDCVFILPKVLLEDKDGKELVFGKYEPETIINIEAVKLDQKESNFIYEFSVWIYRAISVFYSDKGNNTSIVYHKRIVQVGKGQRRLSNTFLDILLSLIQFNKDNQNFFMFILKNLHSGFNKINWTRTIGTTSAIVQDNSPIYLNPVNKKRKINFDEELLVIFFSILNYIGDQYGFPKNINCNFQLIKGKQFQTYLKGLGRTRLLQIKYKYFSDKALELWRLCYAFFDNARKVSVNTDQQEYLLVKNFNIVFEAIIDELIGEKNIPVGLKEQEDGKRVDHMYTYKGLTTYEEDKPIYYIGDSKYYKRGNAVGKESVYKQFTYARNVIQWNLNLFMNDDGTDEDKRKDKQNFGQVPMLRDDVTEGYNIIPNFFISARLDEELSYKKEIRLTDNKNAQFFNKHFKNRLFDRDTLLVCHYDVNFLYVVSLYARNNNLQKQEWKHEVREMFRTQIQSMLKENFDFYAMTAHTDVDARAYIKEHFQDVLGKIYTPYDNKEYFALALDKKDPEANNEELLAELRKHFFVEKCEMGTDPTETLETRKQKEGGAYLPDETWVIVAYYKDERHLNWILKNHLYNMRAGEDKGSISLTNEIINARYLLLYHDENSTHFIKIKKEGSKIYTRAQLVNIGYPQYLKNVKKGNGEDESVVDDSKEQEEAGRIYLVFSLFDSNSAEKEFEGYKWNISKVLSRKQIGNPTPMKLTELLSKACT